MDTASKQIKNEMLQPPLTFNQFLKNPITGMLFLCLIALGYMMWDTKQVTKRQEERILQLEQEVRKANQDIQKLSEENGAMRAELNLRKEYERQK
jgi:hypothetical protein